MAAAAGGDRPLGVLVCDDAAVLHALVVHHTDAGVAFAFPKACLPVAVGRHVGGSQLCPAHQGDGTTREHVLVRRVGGDLPLAVDNRGTKA